MRLYAAFVLLLGLIGCDQTSSGAGASPDAEEAVDTRVKQEQEEGLYTDDDVRKLLTFDIDAVPQNAGRFDYPCLNVVPAGESYPREKVFKELRLDEKRLRDRRSSGMMAVVFLEWQISPSYDLSCMTAINDPENAWRGLWDSTRKVYGIRILKRDRHVIPIGKQAHRDAPAPKPE
jgi:hypothetical protein